MKRLVIIAAALALSVPTAHALTAQQQKMKACNADPASKSLTGDERKAFMSKCLSAAGTESAGGLTPQQEKMKACNADPQAKSLKGPARKAFMSECLKGGAAPAVAAKSATVPAAAPTVPGVPNTQPAGPAPKAVP